jgi:uncharacterized membrane protein YhaH (DUF805 family)
MDYQWLLFSFRGRLNRANYWLAMLIFTAAGLALMVAELVVGNGVAFQVLQLIVNLGAFIAGLAVGIKRLHDRDKSGWWMLFFYVAPVVLALVGAFIGFFGTNAIGLAADSNALLFRVCIALALAIGVWAFVEFGCLRGTVGYNRYGPDPLGKA